MNWTAIQNALLTWFAARTGLTCIWADQDVAQPAYPFGLLNIIAGPTMVGGMDEVRTDTDETIAADVRVTVFAQDETTYTITINGTDFEFISDEDATVAEICSGLVSSINSGAEPVTATASATYVDVEADGEGKTFTIVVGDDFDGDQMVWANNDEGHEMEMLAAGQRELTISCQVLTGSKIPTGDAVHYLTLAQQSLGLPTVRRDLSVAGIAVVDQGSIVNLNETANGRRLAKASMDLRLRIASNLSERTGYIARAHVESDLAVDSDLNFQDNFGEQ